MATFTEALNAARRRAYLSGRPLSREETTGITAGFAETAADRLSKARALELSQSEIAQRETLQKSDIEAKAKLQSESLEAEKQRLAERLAAEKEIESARLAESKRVTDLELQVAQDAKSDATSTKKAVGTAVAGAAVGGYMAAGTAVGGPIGAAVGAILGFVGTKTGICIIIGACTSPNAPEVEIAREYRDKYMAVIELAGYYFLSCFVVPLIKVFPPFKWMVRRFLIARLVDHGKVVLGYKERYQMRSSRAVSEKFLGLCRWIGRRIS